jgi:FtsZ-binding cell division protein ZapB
MKYISWLAGCILVMSLFIFPLQIEAAEETAPTMDKLQQEIGDLKEGQQVTKDIMGEIGSYREYLQTESSKILENLQKTQDNLLVLFTILLSIVGLLVPIAAIGFTYYFGQSKKEHQEQIEQINLKLAKDYEEKMKTKLEELKMQMNQRLMAFLNEEETQIEALKQSIANERTYTSTRILVTGTEAELKRIEQHELRYIAQRLAKKPKTAVYNEKQIFAELEKGQVDILIYSCVPGEINDTTIKRMSQLLIENNYQIPFIIYTYQLEERLDDALTKELNQYLLTTFSNFPTTLIGEIFSLGYAFNQEVRK